METVATGRSKRATAGNRMRELLEKAHQQDEEELFKEEEGDDEFAAPVDQRDVFLEDFADTDDEVEMGSSDEERAIRREERKKAKGKSKAAYNPLAPAAAGSSSTKIKSVKFPSEPTAAPTLPKDAHLLDPNIDASLMAPSTLVLALRKKRREQKRLARDQVLRSTLRASTLKTEEEILEREKQQKEGRPKGKRAQHETGQIKVVKRLTQDELIAAALEEEERNKEALRDWVRREEERRELRRVGRKRVVGPRWTFVTRTVGKLVEEVEAGVDPMSTSKPPETVGPDAAETSDPARIATNTDDAVAEPEGKKDMETGNVDPTRNDAPVQETAPTVEYDKTSDVAQPVKLSAAETLTTESQAEDTPAAGQAEETAAVEATGGETESSGLPNSAVTPPALLTPTAIPSPTAPTAPGDLAPTTVTTGTTGTIAPAPTATTGAGLLESASAEAEAIAGPPPAELATSTEAGTTATTSVAPIASAAPPLTQEGPAQYTRNYIILSEIPGGLAAELRLILGDHVEWDEVKYIPHRNRPISEHEEIIVLWIPVICPFTGVPARYRHPQTNTPYATVEGYKQIEALLQHRYMWDEASSVWYGGEEDLWADGVVNVEGWAEAVHGGWMGGKEIVLPEAPMEETTEAEDAVEAEAEADPEVEGEPTPVPASGKGKKRKAAEGSAPPAAKKAKSKAKAGKGKGRGR